MMTNLLFSQFTAIGKRFAMVLTMLLIVGIGQVWGETATYTLDSSNNGGSVTIDNVSWAIASGAITVQSSNCKLTGTITVTLPTGATLNKVSIAKSNTWGSGATVTLKTGSTTLNTFSNSGDYTLTTNKDKLTYTFTKSGDSGKNAWVKSITVDYIIASSGGGNTGDDNTGSESDCDVWKLVTDASDLKAGDQIVIAASDADYALSTTQQTNNRTGTSITKTGNTLEINSFVQILTLEEGSETGTFAFKDTDGTNNGYLYAASSSSNHLKTKSTKDEHGAFSIEINAEGVASIQAKSSSNRNILRYNAGNTPPLFSCYEPNKMADVSIYKFIECTAETTHSVTYELNGGTGNCPTQEDQTAGSTFKLASSDGISKTGYNFAGWNDGETTYSAGDTYTMPNKPVTLTAQWTAIKNTITLNANGGSGNTTSVAATYDSPTLNPSSITNPTKTGHTFGGWYSGEGGTGSLVINSSGKLQANVSGFTGTNSVWKATTNKTLYAKWTPAVYTITYKDQGNATFSGTHESGNPTQHTYGTETPLKGATKTGYTFSGWYKEAICTNKVTSLGATEYTANITLYAQWTANTYTVKFDGNGSDGGSMTNQPFTYGQSQALSANAFTRTDYAFKNWNTKSDGTGTSYTDKQSVSNLTATNGATVTLYAQWTPIYTITWLANGQNHHTQSAEEGTALAMPSAPDMNDYDACDDKVFVGWTATQISGSINTRPADLFTTKSGTLTANKTYYAVFATAEGTPSTDYAKITNVNDLTDGNYVIAYSYDGGTQVVLKNTTKNTTQMNGTNLSLSSGIYANPDAAYIWQLTKQADNSYYIHNSSASKYLSATTSALQLSDNPTKYNISYDSSNSRWTVVLKDNSTYYMHGYVSGSSYDFRVSTSGSGNKYRIYLYKNTSTVTYSEYVTTCVQVTKYNVTYNIGDATGTAPTESPKAEDTEFTLASADGLTKDGYSFAGWLCNHDSKTYNAGEEYTMPAADVTFTAQWNELPKYTVTFYNKGKKYSEVTQTTAFAAVECPIDLVACDGYTFAGWSTEELDGVSTFSKIEGEYTPTENITLYAVYAEGNVTTNGWVKVTDLSTITEGTYALLSNNDYAFNGTINDGHGQSTFTAFVFDGEGVATSVPNGICEIQLIATGSGFTMYNESKGYLYAKAASSGNLEWHATENSSWSWSSTKENWVYADKNAYLRSYNNTFRTYGNNSNNAIFFAKKNITSFTTSPACDPMITIGSEAPVMVTSAKGIRVDAVQNITISATNLDQNADKAQVSIKIVSDNSAFKFKEVDANGDGQATLTWTGIANATFDKTLCITYTPTEAGQEETATLTVTAYRHNGSTEYATATMQVRGRSLPEQFVLVANTGDGWVALPNTLGTGSTASIPYPIAVEVDNDADPTSIPLAPSTTIYKAAARSTVNTIPTGLRFTTETGGYMQASATETNIWLASNNSDNMQSWTLNSTDFVDYSIRVNNAAEGHYLNYSNTQKKIGNYKSDNKLRILPIEDICEQHAAPGNLKSVTVLSTSATIQWDAVATATSGYEYRIGTIGEWTKIGNVTELELTKLSSLTNYIVYVRASVEGTNTNCSNEAEAEFTTLNCDDVPYDIHYASGANSVTVYWTCDAATSTVSLYRDKEGLSLVETKTSVTSPCQFTGLDKFTTYYVQIQAGGSCPSGMIQVSTEQLDLDVVEWMSDGVVVDVNTDETITVTLENEVQYGSGVGQVAEELFFSKYFEGSGNLKLLAIYNGTGKDVDLSTYRIDRGNDGDATDISKTYNLSQLGTIKNGQEIIFYSKPNVGEHPYSCSQSFLASKGGESGVDANPRWILCDAKTHNGIEFEAMDFSGNDPLLLYKSSELIDVFGVSTEQESPASTQICSGRSDQAWSADGVTNMDYGKTTEDFPNGEIPYGVNVDDETITAYTARVIMFRKNTVLSGSNAVAENKTDFVTLASEWEVRSVCKSGDDGDLTCGAYQELGIFNYADYYTKYVTMAGEQVFDENARLDDETIKISIPNLSTYSCKNIKFNVKVGGVTINEVTKVPILIANEQSTNGGEVFTNLKTTLGTTIVNGSDVTIEPLTDEQLLEKCEACDVVVLASGKLTHEADGISHFDDLTIYPNGVFLNTSDFTVNSLLVHAKLDTVGFAVIENESVTLATNTIAHTKRIDAKYWYPFSLPYKCNIEDIKQANGESLGDYGVHWGIQYYNGKKRQESGTSAGIGQSSNFWTPIYDPTEQLNAYQGYMIALFDAAVESPTEMRTIYFPPVSEQMYTESGTDSKETTITSWNVNLEAEKRHHGWNFTGSPYISVFNPQATGLTEDLGLISEVLMKSGYYDPETNEYLYDNNNVYVSVPSPNGAKYYDQYITSATSLKPFTAYFVQAIDPTSGNDETQTLAYAKAGRELPASAPARAAATKQRVLVELNITAPDGQTDNTGIWVDERYTTDYEIAADLTKMYATGTRPQLYTLAANNEKLAYNALPDNAAAYIPLGLYAPVVGDYTLTLDERVSRIAGAESVELLYNNQLVANLLYQDYTITANKGTVSGYSLSIRRRADVSTAVDNTTGSTITLIANDEYISLVGVPTDATISIYDMLGRLISSQQANGQSVVNMPIVPQGVYNIVVANGTGYTTIKSVIK